MVICTDYNVMIDRWLNLYSLIFTCLRVQNKTIRGSKVLFHRLLIVVIRRSTQSFYNTLFRSFHNTLEKHCWHSLYNYLCRVKRPGSTVAFVNTSPSLRLVSTSFPSTQKANKVYFWFRRSMLTCLVRRVTLCVLSKGVQKKEDEPPASSFWLCHIPIPP